METFLKPNNQYTLTIKMPGSKSSMSFRTKMEPMYIHIDDAKDDVSFFFDDVSNTLVANTIHQNSLYAKAITKLEFEDDGTPPMAVLGYVRAKTKCHLLTKAYIGMVNHAVNRIQLADFSVGRDTNIWNDMKPILEDCRDEVKDWEMMLMGRTIRGYASPKSGTISENTKSNPYGMNARW